MKELFRNVGEYSRYHEGALRTATLLISPFLNNIQFIGEKKQLRARGEEILKIKFHNRYTVRITYSIGFALSKFDSPLTILNVGAASENAI